MGYHGPSGLLQRGDETARGLLCVATALRGLDHYPGDLSRACRRAAHWQGCLHYPRRRASRAEAHHPVAPHLITLG